MCICIYINIYMYILYMHIYIHLYIHNSLKTVGGDLEDDRLFVTLTITIGSICSILLCQMFALKIICIQILKTTTINNRSRVDKFSFYNCWTFASMYSEEETITQHTSHNRIITPYHYFETSNNRAFTDYRSACLSTDASNIL